MTSKKGKRGFQPTIPRPTIGGKRVGAGAKLKVEDDDGNKVGARNLEPKQRREYNAEVMRQSRARAKMPSPVPLSLEEKEEEQKEARNMRLASRARLATRTGEDERVIDSEEDSEEDDDGGGGGDVPGPGGDQKQPNNEEEEDDVMGEEGEVQEQAFEDVVTLDELPETEQQSTGETDVLLKEIVDLLLTYRKEPSEEKDQLMKEIMTRIYQRTMDGGNSTPFAVYYHPDVELHRDPNFSWPECPERTQAIMKALESEGLLATAVQLSEKRLLKREEAGIHSKKVWEDNCKLESMTDAKLEKTNNKYHDAGLTIYGCRDSFAAARIAAGMFYHYTND